MNPYKWSKQPAERRRLEFDASKSLISGDAVLSATAVMYDGDVDVSSSMISGSPTVITPKVYVIVLAGTDGKLYNLKVQITTTLGEVIEDDLEISIKQRGK